MKSLPNQNTLKYKCAYALACLALLVAMGLAAPPSANAAALIHLIALECIETEDSVTDEILLTAGDYRFRHIMKRGWSESLYANFRVGVTVRLYDLDSGPFDRNDYLGFVRIEATRPSNAIRTHTFRRHGARYRLLYSVLEVD